MSAQECPTFDDVRKMIERALMSYERSRVAVVEALYGPDEPSLLPYRGYLGSQPADLRYWHAWRDNWRGCSAGDTIDGCEMINAVLLADRAIAALGEQYRLASIRRASR